MSPDPQSRAGKFHAAIVCLCGAALFLIAYRLRAVLNPLLVALAIAYILNPVVILLQRMGMRRITATVVIFGILVVTVAVAIPVGGTLVYNQARLLYYATRGEPLLTDADGDGVYDPAEGDTFLDANGNGRHDPRGYASELQEWLRGKIDAWNRSTATQYHVNKENVVKLIGSVFQANDQGGTLSTGVGITRLVAQILSRGITGILWFLTLVLLIPVYAFFFMLHLDGIAKGCLEYVPAGYRARTMSILLEIHTSVSGFLRGKLLIFLGKVLLCWIGLAICGVKFSLLIAIGYSVLSLLPIVGLLAGVAAAELLLYVDYGVTAWGAMVGAAAVIVALEALEGLVATPLLLGRQAAIHPATLIVAMLAGGELFGLFGVLLAVPLASVAKILGRELLLPHLKALTAAKDTAGTEP